MELNFLEKTRIGLDKQGKKFIEGISIPKKE